MILGHLPFELDRVVLVALTKLGDSFINLISRLLQSSGGKGGSESDKSSARLGGSMTSIFASHVSRLVDLHALWKEHIFNCQQEKEKSNKNN
jgi:hypothetical protein